MNDLELVLLATINKTQMTVHFSLTLVPGWRHCTAPMAGGSAPGNAQAPRLLSWCSSICRLLFSGHAGVPQSRHWEWGKGGGHVPSTQGHSLVLHTILHSQPTGQNLVVTGLRLSVRETETYTLYSVQQCAKEEGTPAILGQITAFAILGLGWLWVNL